MKRIKTSEARWLHSVREGIRSKRVEEILQSDRGYWYDRASDFADLGIDWEYEYTKE